MAANHTIEIDGKAYSVRLGWNAIRRIEQACGGEAIQAIGMRMVLGQAGLSELGIVFWAGLETARIKEQSRPQPYTLEEAGDLIDEFGADKFFERVYPQLLVALTEAFPTIKAAKDQKDAERDKGPQPAVPTDGTGTGSSPTPPTTD